jgi:hypothetical protein
MRITLGVRKCDEIEQPAGNFKYLFRDLGRKFREGESLTAGAELRPHLPKHESRNPENSPQCRGSKPLEAETPSRRVESRPLDPEHSCLNPEQRPRGTQC